MNNVTDNKGYIELEKKYCAKNYNPLPVVLTKGEDVWLWDDKGKKYLDMMSAYSAVSHGHSNPEILKVFIEQAKKLCITSRAYYTDKLGAFLKKICELSSLDMALPMNTGAEAVETAIKAARLWGYKAKDIPNRKAEIITAAGNFHGRTTTVVGFSTEESYKDGFGPFTPGFRTVPFGDVQAIEKSITENTCAVLLEPIQGEAGIVVPPEGYLAKVKEICEQRNVLLILDEIQSGIGRTGKMFCHQHDGIIPDILLLGKAIGGGMMPVSCVVGRKGVMSLFTPGSHGSTFGGNPLGSTVALKALELMESQGLVENSEKLGEYFKEELSKIKHEAIKDVRGKGLWIGFELYPEKIPARDFCKKLMEKGILSKETHETVVRFAPPLTIKKEQVDWTLEVIKEILETF